MRFLMLSLVVFLGACSSRTFNTGQYFTVELVGTDEAYCIISTPYNRYALNAPDTAFIERSSSDLKVDCRDNAIDRRRTVTFTSEWDGVYYRYPEVVTIDFSTLDNGSRYNGFRAETTHSSEKYAKPALTEDSYSKPVEVDQSYPVKKTYTMGRKSYPVPLDNHTYSGQKTISSSPYALTPMEGDKAQLMDPSSQTSLD